MQIKTDFQRGQLTIHLMGDWTRQYPGVPDAARDPRVRAVVVSGRGLGRWDASLLVFIRTLMRDMDRRRVTVTLQDMPDGVMTMARLMGHRAPAAGNQAVPMPLLDQIGDWGCRVWAAAGRGVAFVGRVGASLWRGLRGHAQTRPVDWWFAFDAVGPRAILIVSLISFLIGLILAFVGAAQLELFGAQIYVASLVAIASIRIMGAMMTGIIMAGRTGAAYAASIGTMQVNEELDALRVMGISRIDFLVLPRVVAMAVTMPILTLLADAMAIAGGLLVGTLMFRIPAGEYMAYTWDALGAGNFWVGIFHGFVYGLIIALCGCYYGIYCGRNADSVGRATTRAVVTSIVWMVVATGALTFLFQVMGI
ncbi:ABC transporter permease [bacterium]|nr:ABC transporter permease [bacterium]